MVANRELVATRISRGCSPKISEYYFR